MASQPSIQNSKTSLAYSYSGKYSIKDLLGFSALLIALWGIKWHEISLASQPKLGAEQSRVQERER